VGSVLGRAERCFVAIGDDDDLSVYRDAEVDSGNRAGAVGTSVRSMRGAGGGCGARGLREHATGARIDSTGQLRCDGDGVGEQCADAHRAISIDG